MQRHPSDAVAVETLTREAARRKAAKIKTQRATIYAEVDTLGREQEALERATQYVEMARSIGIGNLVLRMPTEAKRRFFQPAFRTITLDGIGRGKWCNELNPPTCN